MDTDVRSSLSALDSLRIMQRCLAQARRQLIMPDGPLAKVWGLVVALGFAGMFVLRLPVFAPPAAVANFAAATVWLVAIGAGLWFSTRLGRSYYASRRGVWSPVMNRLIYVWLFGIVLGGATAAAAGLGIDGIIAVIGFFVST